ncbi:MAG: MBL fold metallo-hydrolase [cyanobacterium endosymbiont of Rhopalodia musculus]|uniref:MBL fold metallo-hydrolase n=1 Tax=cyanobacterium endosymbiont of Epithemia clementina EcSB TaxID=3034674 RepID=UPI0024813D6F|nr:MBL fold metallo-hydrolase [cyanobacterium endosymbiont of Epithemia clementina EcSB]WGT67930.1 MBL fold metallo-hydrolase [cyanobacterium endosymbiont of Epithemia clementina EcSB]
MFQKTARLSKLPRQLLEGLFAFPSNKDTLGGAAYFILEKTGNILVDCPEWNQQVEDFLQQHGGVRCLFITHRGGMSRSVKSLQKTLKCLVVIQEQEAYLLPEVNVTSFEEEIFLSPGIKGVWTPGHSPGSSCLYWSFYGGILFTGRHLLCDSSGTLTPLQLAKTFHWLRQLKSVQMLRDYFNSGSLTYICPGANIEFLLEKGLIDRAYEQLYTLNLDNLRKNSVIQ